MVGMVCAIFISLLEMEAHYVPVFLSSEAMGAVAKAIATTLALLHAHGQVVATSSLELASCTILYHHPICSFNFIFAILPREASLEKHMIVRAI
ncbi:hypothetical protein V6N13_034283 [Hibiscus sabdariffa]|uniref:Uncharacterized protein n=1 Tax=Hibiscus sabdariffa TaxID=183260 RepID=A0ABR2F7Z1_9ROSI